MKNPITCPPIARAARLSGKITGSFGVLWLSLAVASLTGCATGGSKPKAQQILERGWIGGEYKLAEKPSAGRTLRSLVPFTSSEDAKMIFPPGLPQTNQAGILIASLATNSPAGEAGLQEGDLVLSCAGKGVTTLRSFQKAIDRSTPGALLPVTVWRRGQTFATNVVVGRETYTESKAFTMTLGIPPKFWTFDQLNPWPDPGFSLYALGFDPAPDKRIELGSAESSYDRACLGDKYRPSYRDWTTWLAIFEFSGCQEIQTQERVAAGAGVYGTKE